MEVRAKNSRGENTRGREKARGRGDFLTPHWKWLNGLKCMWPRQENEELFYCLLALCAYLGLTYIFSNNELHLQIHLSDWVHINGIQMYEDLVLHCMYSDKSKNIKFGVFLVWVIRKRTWVLENLKRDTVYHRKGVIVFAAKW
jgi:hypothetical protein